MRLPFLQTNPRRLDLPFHRFLISTALVSVMTAMVVIAVLLRDLTIAYRFGTSDAVDAFLIALLVPTFIVQIVGTALGTSVVPRILALEGNDPRRADSFITHVISAGTLLLGISWLLLALFADQVVAILAAGFPAHKAAVTHQFYLWLLPSILLQGWSTLVGALINARSRFGLVAIAPAMRPCLTILLLCLSPAGNPMLLVWGYLGGCILEAVLVALSGSKAKIPLRFAWPQHDTWQALDGFGATSSASIIMAGSILATQYLAGFLAAGSVAALSFGGKVISLVIALGALPMSVTLLPMLSDLRAKSRWQALFRTLVQGAGILSFSAILLAAGCVVFSMPLVSVLFQRGAFTEADAILVADIQRDLALQLPFYLVGILWVRALAAFQQNWAILVVAIVNALTNLAVSLVLMPTLGVKGLALGITAGYVTGASLAGYFALSSLAKIRRKSVLDQAMRNA